eukprot:SAG31_NODE_26098_length_448_cov_1.048711_1_plen_52_part_00
MKIVRLLVVGQAIVVKKIVEVIGGKETVCGALDGGESLSGLASLKVEAKIT